jgi:hypothetical protein
MTGNDVHDGESAAGTKRGEGRQRIEENKA